MSFKLTILGSSSALPTSNRFPTAHVLNIHERFFLIDCGEGTQIQIRRYGIGFAKINHIFISHLHGDHFFGLFGLLSTFDLMGRKHDLHIYAHEALEKMLSHQYAPMRSSDLRYKLIFHRLNTTSEQIIFEDKLVTVTSFPLEHRVPVCGFLFAEKQRELNIRSEMIKDFSIPISEIVKIKNGADFTTTDGKIIKNKQLTLPPVIPRKYAFCTDTVYLERIVPSIKNVDLLYHEATYDNSKVKEAKQTKHTTASQAAAIAKLAEVKKLVIGHFSVRYHDTANLLSEAKAIFSNTIAATEGLKIEIPECRVSN